MLTQPKASEGNKKMVGAALIEVDASELAKLDAPPESILPKYSYNSISIVLTNKI